MNEYNDIKRKPNSSPKPKFGSDIPSYHCPMDMSNVPIASQRLACVTEHSLKYSEQQLMDDNNRHPPLPRNSPLQHSIPQQEKASVGSIILLLEKVISRFPNDVLLLDDPLVSSIRSQISSLSSAFSSQERYEARHPLRSPIALRSEFPPRTSSYNQSGMQQSTTLRPSPKISGRTQIQGIYAPHSRRHPSSHINTQSLRSIFPQSSEFMRSALYVYILIHTFINSLPRPIPPRTSSLHDPQVTSHLTQIPSKAIALLDLHRNANELGIFIQLDEVISSRRLQDLGINIRKCIYTLISTMDSSCHVVSEGFENVDLESPSILLRSLEEVVRNCEGRIGG
jgi:hypothetical protein